MDESGEKHSAFTPGVILETATICTMVDISTEVLYKMIFKHYHGKVRVSHVSHMHI